MATATDRSFTGESGLPLRYLLIAFAFTWVFWWPATLAEQGVITLPVPNGLLIVIGTFGPMVAALVLAAAEEGGGGVRALLGRVLHWRVAPIWWAVAILGPLLISLAAIALHIILSGQPADHAGIAAYLPNVVVRAIYMMLFVALGEEVGWRGHALPALQARYSAFWSSVILGAVWAVWHLPQFFNPAMSYSRLPFPLFVAYLVPFTILITGLYNSTRGSLLLVIVFHAVMNASTDLWASQADLARLAAVSPIEANVRVNALNAVVVALAAVVLILVGGPRNLSNEPRQILDTEDRAAGEPLP